MTQQSMREYVAAGVDLLNRVRPGWEDEVCVSTLDLHSCTDCVLGQLYAEYERGITDMGWEGWELASEPTLHGFNALYDNCQIPIGEYGSFVAGLYSRLTQEWQRQIIALRLEKKELRELEIEPEEIEAEVV